MGMKLIVAIVQNDIADDLIDDLTSAHFGATRLASTGGFLRQGNTTIMVGVPEEAVDNVLVIIGQNSQDSKQGPINAFPVPGVPSVSVNAKNANQPTPNFGIIEQAMAQGAANSAGASQASKRATVFVLNLDRYERV